MKNKEEEQVERLLSSLPRVAPEIKIDLVEDDEREIIFNPGDECSLPPVVGAQGFYVDYEALSHEFLEATFIWNRRRTRWRHTWYIDQYRPGGDWLDDERFHLCWCSHSLYRATPSQMKILDDLTCKERNPLDRRIGTEERVSWTDTDKCSGPESGGSLYAGNTVLHVVDRSLSCVRAVIVHPEEQDPDDAPEPGEPSPEWQFLDDTYVTPDGRIALTRRFITRDKYTLHQTGFDRSVKLARDDWAKWSFERERIIYNGIEFRHYFDILTDVSLGWPLPPPFRIKN